uniref:NTF2 domain-containing protein n=1 Tax=Chenopodium quinoa TaxID=63459 RepID=A0A803MHE9_CHEQI
MEQGDQVARAFVEHYYTTFDTNRAALSSLYQEISMLTFEGQKFQGAQNIVGKLTSLPFEQCKHSITTTDCQPSSSNGTLLVFVSGIFSLLVNSTFLSLVRYQPGVYAFYATIAFMDGLILEWNRIE